MTARHAATLEAGIPDGIFYDEQDLVEARFLTTTNHGIAPIDWPSFWSSEAPRQDWLLEPLVPARRQAAIFSPAKVGKSLLALDAAAAKATGRSFLGQPPGAPVDVVYIDLEMTPSDLRERMADLGYGPNDDLGRLRYYPLPSLPPLDSDPGGELLTSLARECTAALVVIDTMARAVGGEENNADTYRRFYEHTGRRLKAAGVALLRLDHAGKDASLGQRGSSAKADDLDVVWRLAQVDRTRLTLTLTHSRVPWVPPEVAIVRYVEPVLRHVLAPDGLPAGTHEVAELLESIGVPLNATEATASAALRANGTGRRKAVVLNALRYRREER